MSNVENGWEVVSSFWVVGLALASARKPILTQGWYLCWGIIKIGMFAERGRGGWVNEGSMTVPYEQKGAGSHFMMC